MLLNFENLTFQILTVSRAGHPSGRFHVKPRPYAALSLRLRGTGIFSIGGKRLTSNEGDILYIPADMPYEAEYSVSEMVVIHLSQCNYPEPEIIHAQNRSATEAHFLQLLDSWNHKCSQHLAKAQIYSLLDMLASEMAHAADQSVLLRCTSYMEENFYKTNLTVEIICKDMYVSRSTLQRTFLRHFGVSPQQYLTRIRMNHALNLLTNGCHTVKETAGACGFLDEKYFSVVFKKVYGCSPSRLKNNAGI